MRSEISSDGASLEKITNDAFKALVDESLKLVTKKMALAFARKARMFKLAYHALADKKDATRAQCGEQTPFQCPVRLRR